MKRRPLFVAALAALEESGKVIAVLQGHRHEGGFSTINGIPYFTFKGLVEGAGPWNSSYSVVDVMPDLSLQVLGYRRAETRSFRAATAEALLGRR
jgi:alkaline phosphatase